MLIFMNPSSPDSGDEKNISLTRQGNFIRDRLRIYLDEVGLNFSNAVDHEIVMVFYREMGKERFQIIKDIGLLTRSYETWFSEKFIFPIQKDLAQKFPDSDKWLNSKDLKSCISAILNQEYLISHIGVFKKDDENREDTS